MKIKAGQIRPNKKSRLTEDESSDPIFLIQDRYSYIVSER